MKVRVFQCLHDVRRPTGVLYLMRSRVFDRNVPMLVDRQLVLGTGFRTRRTHSTVAIPVSGCTVVLVANKSVEFPGLESVMTPDPESCEAHLATLYSFVMWYLSRGDAPCDVSFDLLDGADVERVVQLLGRVVYEFACKLLDVRCVGEMTSQLRTLDRFMHAMLTRTEGVAPLWARCEFAAFDFLGSFLPLTFHGSPFIPASSRLSVFSVWHTGVGMTCGADVAHVILVLDWLRVSLVSLEGIVRFAQILGIAAEAIFVELLRVEWKLMRRSHVLNVVHAHVNFERYVMHALGVVDERLVDTDPTFVRFLMAYDFSRSVERRVRTIAGNRSPLCDVSAAVVAE